MLTNKVYSWTILMFLIVTLSFLGCEKESPTGTEDLTEADASNEIIVMANIPAFDMEVEVDLDIKPTSCPNPLNTKSKGNLPVAVLGTANLDVNDIDVSTVQLEGVDPIRSAIEDVATPVANRQDDCDCTTDGPDGFDDLTLKFDTQAIVAALGAVNDGDEVKLTITGNFNDGTPITGLDCVIIKKKGK